MNEIKRRLSEYYHKDYSDDELNDIIKFYNRLIEYDNELNWRDISYLYRSGAINQDYYDAMNVIHFER